MVDRFSIRGKFGDVMHISDVAENIFCMSPAYIRRITYPNKKIKKFVKGYNLCGIFDGSKKLYITIQSIHDYLEYHSMRDFEKDSELIKNAKEKICILGINALGPLHRNRENFINFLKNKGNLQILLLDPESDEFKNRVNFEEYHNGKICHRLIAEYNASLAICKDIYNFSDGNGIFELKIHRNKPKMSLVIVDPDNSVTGLLNQNVYPEIPELRGLTGKQFQISKKDDTDHFIGLNETFRKLWDSASKIDLKC